MPTELSPDDLRLLLAEADQVARRLQRSLRLPYGEREDLRQDLLVDLIARLPAFNPQRGTLGAFAGMVLQHRSAVLAEVIARHRRLFGRVPVSLYDTIADEDGVTTLGDIIADDEGLSALHGQVSDPTAEAERRIDLSRALGHIPTSHAALCAALAARSTERVAADGPLSRATVRRRITELRHVLTAHGLQAA